MIKLFKKHLNWEGIKNSIFKNTFWLTLSELFIRWSGLLITILIARFLWVEEFWKFSFALTFVWLIWIISDFWLSSLIIKDISRDKKKLNYYITNIIYIKIFLGIFLLIILYPIIYSLWFMSDIYILYSATLYIILNGFLNIFRSIFKAVQKNEYDTKLQFINGILLLLLVSPLIVYKSSIAIIFLWYTLVSILILFFSISFVNKLLWLKYKTIDYILIKKLLYKSWPFLLSSICIFIYYFADSILLYMFKWEYEVWIYSAWYKILTLLIAPIWIYSFSLFPVLSKSFKEKKLDLNIKKILINNIKYIFFISMLITLFIIFFSKYIIIFMYWKEYIESIYILQLLIISWFIIANSSIVGISLQAFDEQKMYFIVTLLWAFLNIYLNFLFIPKYSIIWAAIATIFTDLLVWILLYYIFYKKVLSKYKV